MEIIRPMREEDLIKVAAVDVAAFTDWWKNERGKEIALPPRALPVLRSYLEEDPGGCLIDISPEGEVIAYLFSHLWGKIGWIGPLAVLPFHQRGGIARRMVIHAVKHLLEKGATTVALETMPDSDRNLGLYTRSGFRPRGLRLRFSKSALGGWNQGNAGLEFLPIDNPSLLKEVAALSELALPGLDCSQVVHLTAKHALGKSVLIYRDGQAVGFIVLQMAGRRGEGGESYVKILVLVSEEEREGFRAVIRWCEENAVGRLIIPVYTIYWRACQELLDLGYSIVSSGVRMFYRGDDAYYGQERPLLLSEWAG